MNKIKLLGRCLELFLLSILICIFTILITLKCTILNKEYVSNKFSEEHYQELIDFLKTEMKNSMISSGIDNIVIDQTFTKEDVKKTTKETLDILYEDNTKKIDTSSIEEKLRENIKNNLAEKNFTIEDNTGLNTFVNSIMTIYKAEFIMFNKTSSIGKYMIFTNKVVDKALIILGIILAFWILLRIRQIPKKLPVPLFTSGFLLMFATNYIYTKAGLANFTIISIPFSEIIRLLISSLFDLLKQIAIVSIVVGIVFTLFRKKEEKQ